MLALVETRGPADLPYLEQLERPRNPANITEAVQKVKPFAVDVFSGVNTNGWIDPQKVKEFVKAVRQEQEIHQEGSGG